MGSSFRLFAIRGIDLRLHITFPLILLWAAYQFGLADGNVSGALFDILAISLLFVLVTLHELGHSFAAQFYGFPVKQIVLSPLGGMAQLTEMPEKPSQEFVVAIAGPAVNIVLAILMGLIAYGAGLPLTNPLLVSSGAAGFGLDSLFSYIFFYNIILAVFNLLPAFPLDGGRIFRSLLALKLDYVQATTIASTLGRVLAILLGLYGLINGSFFLVFIAIFIFTAGSQEAQMVRVRSVLRGLTVEQVFSRTAYRLTPFSTVQQALNLMLLGDGQADFPVVDGDRLVGYLPKEALLRAKQTAAPHSYVSAFMQEIEPASSADDLYQVQQRMSKHGLESLPVVSAGRYLGLITRQQIIAGLRMVRSMPSPAPGSHSA